MMGMHTISSQSVSQSSTHLGVSYYLFVGLFVAAILDLIKNLLRDDIPAEQSLFRFVQQKQ
jgi:hypothetical protein